VPDADLLIVEDDADIGSDLVAILRDEGYTASLARDGEQATEAVLRGSPRLVLLDLGLPDMDGVTLCRWLRARLPEVGILVVTARSREIETVMALDAGADDYMVKPFRPGELLARLRALGRRRCETPPELVNVGPLTLDVAARQVFLDDRELNLRPREFDLLAALVRRAGRPVPREVLMREVWGENWFGATKTLDVHVCVLRRKLSAHTADPGRIATLRGHGYRYDAPASAVPQVADVPEVADVADVPDVADVAVPAPRPPVPAGRRLRPVGGREHEGEHRGPEPGELEAPALDAGE
jgi:DNA-binding response OmpR family regulator